MPTDRTLRAALVAWEIEINTQTDNLKRAEQIARNAAEKGAQAIGFTEYFSMLGTGIEFVDSAERPGEGAVTRWAERVAAENNIEIWCPFVELGDDGRKYNSVAIVDPVDGLVGTAQEFHYLALDKMGMSVGQEIRVFNRPWGKLGCFVCFDIHYAECARVLALQGAEVVFWPTMTAGPWSAEAVRTKAITRCMDNGFWLVEANVASPPPYAPYAGRCEPGSCIIDPEGVVVADTGRRPGVQIVEMDITRGSYGSGVLRLGEDTQCEDLRRGFQHCLRAEYYAKTYQELAHSGS